MCFSANVSFGAGLVLTAISVASIKKVQDPKQLMFASIPLIFGLQQFTEGILWDTLTNINFRTTQKAATYVYLFLAQILWPIYVPIAIMLLKKNKKRQTTQRILIASGITIGLYLGYCLLSYPVEANIIGHHIAYSQDYPKGFRYYGMVLYALATIFPPFFSRIKHMKLLGLTILLSYIFTAIFYTHYILSVWCFFSSLISISVYKIMVNQQRNNVLGTGKGY